jgi:CMP-N-acetylneuraminic acid synthetase
MASNLKINPSLLVHLRATSPTRISAVLDEAINTFKKLPDCTSLRSVHEMSESAYKTFEVTAENLLVTSFDKKSNIELSNNARQSFPQTYFANGYIDILRPDLIVKSKMMHGNKVFAFKTSPIIEVDTWYDLKLLESSLELPANALFLEIFR